ncbi:MAG TPA: PSD1 and planctomycete cytochrome C domain-containing protein [Methylomirabilota bacterium]|nr:PSD1 and planctomycete cytochrome C domain-containing protein [Methylomirabilota bacterium]
MKRNVLRFEVSLAIGWLLTAAAPNVSAALPTFEKDIRPILKAHCFDCHGEGEKLKGGLDLRLRRLILQGGDEGPALVPGKPDKSLLFKLVHAGEMPKREKKLAPEQVALIKQWIAAGAKTARPEPAEIGKGAGITEEERAFWSFQPIRHPEVPKTKPKDRARTPVDAFLVSAMAKQKLGFSPDAEKITLLRRACFDLTGLPPTLAEVEAFLADTTPDAYEKLIDRLLDSPHYGERWGRHWLDVAGYADSDGYSDADPPRAYAYKYRDYVIGSFNSDKPFDRFITEQLAGDELARATRDNPQSALAAPHTRELLIATGFLRMGADGTATPAVPDLDAVRNQVVADTIKIVSTSLLGLSVGCAQCHDHRYDPIPQTDYYRLRAVIEPAYDPKNWRTPDQRRVSLYTDADRKAAAQVEADAKKLADEKAAKQKQYIDEALTKHLEKFEAGLRGKLRAAYDTPADKRTAEQKKLLADNPSVNINAGVLYQYNQKAADDLKAMDARIAEIRGRKPPEDFISVLTEPADKVPVTYLFHRGDPKQPKEAIQPGGLSVLAPPGHSVELPEKDSTLASSGRRLAFARWLTSGTNPLVARVLVNRVWLHHFGRGLVGTPSDFGAMGERPSHPELLDWLASDFVGHGWRLKRLHKLIMTSTAYRQSSRRHQKGDARDPENRLYWRKPVQRLDAEAIRDAILATSGALNKSMYGPPVPVRPDVHGQIVVGVDKTEGDNKMPVEVALKGEEFRRGIYIQVRRSRPLAMLHAFDAPVMEVNCERRQNSTVATQSLMLMNSQFMLDQVARFATRLHEEAGDDRGGQVTRAWQIAFSRSPTAQESADALDFLSRQVDYLKSVPEKKDEKPKKDDKAKPAAKPAPELQALTNLCQALLSANEFLYVD